MTLENLKKEIRSEIEQQSFFLETAYTCNQYIPMRVFEQYISLIYGVGFDEGRAQYSHRRPIVQKKDGKVIKVWPSFTSASNKLGIDSSAILQNIKGKTKTCAKCQWEYYEK